MVMETQNKAAVREFLMIVREVDEVEHRMYCVKCGVSGRHRLHVRGYWEFYTCEKCGDVQSFKVK